LHLGLKSRLVVPAKRTPSIAEAKNRLQQNRAQLSGECTVAVMRDDWGRAREVFCPPSTLNQPKPANNPMAGCSTSWSSV
jgi:hypothetical protein